MQETADNVVKFVGVWVAAISTILVLVAPLVGLVVGLLPQGWLLTKVLTKVFPMTLKARSGKPKQLPPVGPVALLFVLLATGCAGTLEESKGMLTLGVPKKAPSSDRCIQLSDRQAVAGGITGGAAFAAGATGIPSIWTEDKTARLVLASAGVGIGIIGGGSYVYGQMTATSWARECAQ